MSKSIRQQTGTAAFRSEVVIADVLDGEPASQRRAPNFGRSVVHRSDPKAVISIGAKKGGPESPTRPVIFPGRGILSKYDFAYSNYQTGTFNVKWLKFNCLQYAR
jgi:hypothetical protein